MHKGYLVLAIAMIVAIMLASPSGEDLATCEKTQSTEVCLHHLYP